MTFVPVLATGGVSGKPVLVAATTSAGTTLHTATAETGESGLDEVWIWATNNHSSAVTLTVMFGGTDGKDYIEQSIPSKQGVFLVVPGWRLNAGTIVKAFASVTNVVSCQVNVNRYAA